MFLRSKQTGGRVYLQIVENAWVNGKAQQRVVANLGRLEKLVESGHLASLIASASRFTNNSFSCFSPGGETYLSSHQLGKLLQVSPSTVVSWVNGGHLPAFRTVGGHRRIKVSDVVKFLRDKGMPVPPELGPTIEPAKKRIFIVDDEPEVIRTIRRSFQHQADFEVDGCTDGIEALVLIGATSPDLVLLDIHMPGLDGFEVCRRLRRISHLEGMKIVAITAFPSEEARARIMDYGASDYWQKPVEVQQVLGLFEGPRVSE